jgi:hypothetical protein
MTFVAVPKPTPVVVPSSPRTVVEHDGWYPATDPAQLREAMRVTEAVTDARLLDAIYGAQDYVGRELRRWRLEREAAGAASLEAVEPDVQIDFEPALVRRYRRAVFHLVMADIVEAYRDITATKDGADRAEQKALGAAEYRRNATHAIRDILGVDPTDVELI